MFRRDFIQRLTVAAGGTGLATAHAAEALDGTMITFKVKGFSCVTCAVGLEVMLRQQKGVIRAKASYPDATVAIQFNDELITQNSLIEFIAEKGFSAEKQSE